MAGWLGSVAPGLGDLGLVNHHADLVLYPMGSGEYTERQMGKPKAACVMRILRDAAGAAATDLMIRRVSVGVPAGTVRVSPQSHRCEAPSPLGTTAVGVIRPRWRAQAAWRGPSHPSPASTPRSPRRASRTASSPSARQPERDAARRLEPIIAHRAPARRVASSCPWHPAALDAQAQRRRRRADPQLLVEFLRRAGSRARRIPAVSAARPGRSRRPATRRRRSFRPLVRSSPTSRRASSVLRVEQWQHDK